MALSHNDTRNISTETAYHSTQYWTVTKAVYCGSDDLGNRVPKGG
jgi:hypothetical protein